MGGLLRQLRGRRPRRVRRLVTTLLAVDGLLDAAVAEGVKRSKMQNLVVNSAIGVMKLVPAGDHPGVLREKIASPGCCSIRALFGAGEAGGPI